MASDSVSFPCPIDFLPQLGDDQDISHTSSIAVSGNALLVGQIFDRKNKLDLLATIQPRIWMLIYTRYFGIYLLLNLCLRFDFFSTHLN
jgi:hypothetical protein